MLGAQEQEDLKVSASGDIDLPTVDLGQTTIGGEVITRPMGMLIHSNLLGTFLALQITVAGALFLSTSSTLLGLWSAAVAAASATALIITYSRSGWAAAAVGLVLWWVVAWKYRALRLTFRQKVIVGLLLIVAAAAVVKIAPKIYLRLTETAGEALTFREDLAAAAWRMTMHNPLTGVGLNTFVYQLAPYDPAQTSRLKAYPVHDIFLLESSETGIGGGVAFLALALIMIWKSFVYAVRCQSRSRRLFGLALFGAIASYWVADLFAFMFRLQVVAAVVWSLLALSFANRVIDRTFCEETPKMVAPKSNDALPYHSTAVTPVASEAEQGVEAGKALALLRALLGIDTAVPIACRTPLELEAESPVSKYVYLLRAASEPDVDRRRPWTSVRETLSFRQRNRARLFFSRCSRKTII